MELPDDGDGDSECEENECEEFQEVLSEQTSVLLLMAGGVDLKWVGAIASRERQRRRSRNRGTLQGPVRANGQPRVTPG
jgi:hypothetical protein